MGCFTSLTLSHPRAASGGEGDGVPTQPVPTLLCATACGHVARLIGLFGPRPSQACHHRMPSVRRISVHLLEANIPHPHPPQSTHTHSLTLTRTHTLTHSHSHNGHTLPRSRSLGAHEGRGQRVATSAVRIGPHACTVLRPIRPSTSVAAASGASFRSSLCHHWPHRPPPSKFPRLGQRTAAETGLRSAVANRVRAPHPNHPSVEGFEKAAVALSALPCLTY